MYINDYTDEISPVRPEKNPFFLEECVVVYFHPRERLHLQKIYDEVCPSHSDSLPLITFDMPPSLRKFIILKKCFWIDLNKFSEN
jgi:hypothetical protein